MRLKLIILEKGKTTELHAGSMEELQKKMNKAGILPVETPKITENEPKIAKKAKKDGQDGRN